ncbi:unnamed protein product [Paramecium primaurelia]|uniref:Methenyltetrahydrofolate cyclohydrolase n=1 Tax=Paramecium primaurelia TaxID=5886 RepID=A0A8S1PIK1_PARPR|nr:unnamed protein product [Paramecium primaurelia]
MSKNDKNQKLTAYESYKKIESEIKFQTNLLEKSNPTIRCPIHQYNYSKTCRQCKKIVVEEVPTYQEKSINMDKYHYDVGDRGDNIIPIRGENAISNMNSLPKLGICLVGDSPASKSYVNRKLKACQEINIDAELFNFSENVEQDQLIKHIQSMNHDGILVQLPLPLHLNKLDIIHSIPYEKDVDCLHMHNLQRILVYGELCEMLPCTPAAVLQILDYYDVNVIGKKVTVIGRSFLVGLPLSLLLQKRNATVTVCHRETLNLDQHIMNADIVISAAGHPKLVRNVKQGAIVIDVGISQGEKKGRIVGDVDIDVVKNQASLITPVPGGVGPMTVCMLMRNLCNIWKKKQGQPVYINPKLSDAYLND